MYTFYSLSLSHLIQFKMVLFQKSYTFLYFKEFKIINLHLGSKYSKVIYLTQGLFKYILEAKDYKTKDFIH